MEPVVMTVFVIVSGILAIIGIVETIEYRRYQRAARSVIAFGEAMQISYNEVAKHLQRNEIRTIENTQGINVLTQDTILLKTILAAHSELLNVSGMKKIFELQDESVAVALEDD